MERAGFFCCALCETVVTPGPALARAPIRVTILASGSLALADTLCLWWLYFHAEPIALRHISSTEDRVYASRMGTNGLLPMIGGLIALAAGERARDQASIGRGDARPRADAVRGSGLFLIARAWYQWLVFSTAPRSQLVTIGVPAATAGVATTAPALVAALAVVAVLAGLVMLEHLNAARNLLPMD